MGAGVLIACTLFITGGLLQHLTGFPGPVLMIVVAAFLKYLNVVPKPNADQNSFINLSLAILRSR